MPRQTKENELPKPPPPPIDWARIARSGKVWEFIEGEDFNGKVSGFRSRAKAAARKCGVDFDYVEVERGGKAVLKVLARTTSGEQQPEAGASADAYTEGATGSVASEAPTGAAALA